MGPISYPGAAASPGRDGEETPRAPFQSPNGEPYGSLGSQKCRFPETKTYNRENWGPDSMVDQAGERALRAFQRLLADASAGGQAKVDALVALSQRVVLVPTWASVESGYRTLVNENGDSALPIFTGRIELERAAEQLGWNVPGQTLTFRECGSRDAFRHAVALDLPFVVVDLGAAHAIEIARSEIEPLLTAAARRESTGPFAAVGRISTSMLRAIKSSEAPPGTEEAARPPSLPAPPALPSELAFAPVPEPTELLTPSSGVKIAGGFRVKKPTAAAITIGASLPPGGAIEESVAPKITESGRYGAAARASMRVSRKPPPAEPNEVTPSMAPRGSRPVEVAAYLKLVAPDFPPSDALLETLAAALRAYPEVEWAGLGWVERGGATPRPTVGLRIQAFRDRLPEINSNLRRSGLEFGVDLESVVLDDADSVRAVRQSGILFYPWRRRPGT